MSAGEQQLLSASSYFPWNFSENAEFGQSLVVEAGDTNTFTESITSLTATLVGELGLEVLHITELLAEDENLQKLFPKNDSELLSVTYQDPCRLGRFMGIYQQPRDMIENLGYELVEMGHNAHTSICCGTSCWTNCGQLNKKVQTDRLKEARSTGAEKLITSCVKCQIHYRCAQGDPVSGSEIQMDIQDLTTLIAERI